MCIPKLKCLSLRGILRIYGHFITFQAIFTSLVSWVDTSDENILDQALAYELEHTFNCSWDWFWLLSNVCDIKCLNICAIDFIVYCTKPKFQWSKQSQNCLWLTQQKKVEFKEQTHSGWNPFPTVHKIFSELSICTLKARSNQAKSHNEIISA